MPILAENKGSNFNSILAPDGNHVAVCVRMIHIGTIEVRYQDETKLQNKVRLYFELSHEKAVFDEEKGEENFMVSKEYTLSMHEKASLRKDLESWRGKAFTEDEAKSFDITKLLGVPCMVNIITKTHEPTGNKYTALTGITSIPKGIPTPDRINDLFEFSVLEFDEEKFDNLSDFLKEKIRSSIEYTSMVNGEIAEGNDNELEGNSNDGLPF